MKRNIDEGIKYVSIIGVESVLHVTLFLMAEDSSSSRATYFSHYITHFVYLKITQAVPKVPINF